MHRLFFWVTVLPTLVVGRPTAECSSKPPAFFLAGDSTTAPNGGWGDGLLSFIKSPALGVNIGKSGATTASFSAGGYWANVTKHLQDSADKYDGYVTISMVLELTGCASVATYQFGHNDQKATSGVTFEQYQANLIRFANEVKSLGGTPLLTSSLTRRAFPSGQDHNATDSLHDQRLAAIAAGQETKSPIIDLNEASLKYVNAIGKKAAYEYNYGDDKKDTTHLNPHGAVVFGRMVADLIIREDPCFERWFTPNETLSNAIWHNQPA